LQRKESLEKLFHDYLTLLTEDLRDRKSFWGWTVPVTTYTDDTIKDMKNLFVRNQLKPVINDILR